MKPEATRRFGNDGSQSLVAETATFGAGKNAIDAETAPIENGEAFD